MIIVTCPIGDWLLDRALGIRRDLPDPVIHVTAEEFQQQW
jgi:hypothetical protein